MMRLQSGASSLLTFHARPWKAGGGPALGCAYALKAGPKGAPCTQASRFG